MYLIALIMYLIALITSSIFHNLKVNLYNPLQIPLHEMHTCWHLEILYHRLQSILLPPVVEFPASHCQDAYGDILNHQLIAACLSWSGVECWPSILSRLSPSIPNRINRCLQSFTVASAVATLWTVSVWSGRRRERGKFAWWLPWEIQQMMRLVRIQTKLNSFTSPHRKGDVSLHDSRACMDSENWVQLTLCTIMNKAGLRLGVRMWVFLS